MRTISGYTGGNWKQTKNNMYEDMDSMEIQNLSLRQQ